MNKRRRIFLDGEDSSLFLMAKTKVNIAFFYKKWYNEGYEISRLHLGLGGTLLDNYETSTAAFVETLAEFGIEQEHDSVYEALKVSTAFAIEKYAPGIENFLEKYKENEARELEHPVFV